MPDVDTVRFILPLPPSINSQYTQVGNRRVLSKEHTKFKKQVQHQGPPCCGLTKLSPMTFINRLNSGWVGLFLDFYFESPRRRDLDGGLKITQDALLTPWGLTITGWLIFTWLSVLTRPTPGLRLNWRRLPPGNLTMNTFIWG
jgi:hypothetical protein